MQKNNRNPIVDLAKGFAIILMVIGHCYSSENAVLRMIYAFHMPFFFLISGALYAEKWRHGIYFHTARTCRKLLIPYFLFDSLFALFVIILGRQGDTIELFCHTFACQILPLVGKSVTWLLPCQLVLLCIFVLVAKHGKRWVCLLLFAVLYLMGLFGPAVNALLPLR